MRKVLVITLLLMLCGGALAEDVPGNRLGLELLAALSDGEQNVFISPVSLGYALSMAASGAAGDTREELLKALRAEDPADIAALNEALSEAGLRWANAAFVRPDAAIRGEFTEALGRDFEAECFPLEDVQPVNEWVSERTDGMIDSVLDQVPSDVVMMLMNAVAMDAKWASPFHADETEEDDFHAPGGDVRASFMRQTARMQYGESAGVQFVRKAYEGGSLSMLIALPKEGKLAAALKGLKDKGLDWFHFDAMPQQVALRLPKLDLNLSFDLSQPLQDAGVRRAFAEDADFTAASEEQTYVSQVLQKLRIQVDEDGTKAAAVTAVVAANGMSLFTETPEPVEMNVDRPFVLAIVDDATGAILFAGAVTNPAA